MYSQIIFLFTFSLLHYITTSWRWYLNLIWWIFFLVLYLLIRTRNLCPSAQVILKQLLWFMVLLWPPQTQYALPKVQHQFCKTVSNSLFVYCFIGSSAGNCKPGWDFIWAHQKFYSNTILHPFMDRKRTEMLTWYFCFQISAVIYCWVRQHTQRF